MKNEYVDECIDTLSFNQDISHNMDDVSFITPQSLVFDQLSIGRQMIFEAGLERLPTIVVRSSGEGVYEVTLSEIKRQNLKMQLKSLSIG